MTTNTLKPFMFNGVELPPEPPGGRYKNALRFGEDPHGFLSYCRKTVGKHFTLKMPGSEPMVWTSDPDVVKAAIKIKGDAFDAGRMGIPFDPGERAVAFMNGDEHKNERRMIFPAVHNTGLKAMAQLMQDCCRSELKPLRSGDKVDIGLLMQSMTLDVITRCVFGANSEDKVKRFRELTLRWTNLAVNPKIALSGTIFTAYKQRAFLNKRSLDSYYNNKFRKPGRKLLYSIMPWLKLCDARAEFMRALMDEINAAREENDLNRNDLLNVFALIKTEDGNFLEEENILSELVGILVAGHETTARTSAFVLAHVLKNPDIIRNIRAEINTVFKGDDIDPSRVDELKYLQACIDESQRLRPLAPAFNRALTKDVKMGELSLPANVSLLCSIYLVQNDPEYWGNDVSEYRPERFLDKKIPLEHFMPFGGGRRRCLGAAFASQQMLIQLAEIISRCDFSGQEDYVIGAIQSGQAADLKNPFVVTIKNILNTF